MSDPVLILTAIGVVFGGICAVATVKSLSILKRSAPKLPEPPSTPVCTTILGVDMHDRVRDLPGHSRRTLGKR